MSIHQSITVGFEYDVIFTRDVFAEDNPSLVGVFGEGKSRVVFYVDDGLVAHWPKLAHSITDWCARHAESIELAAPVQLVPGGERIKNDLDILDRFGTLAADVGLDRHSYVVIVGGGAVLDAQRCARRVRELRAGADQARREAPHDRAESSRRRARALRSRARIRGHGDGHAHPREEPRRPG